MTISTGQIEKWIEDAEKATSLDLLGYPGYKIDCSGNVYSLRNLHGIASRKLKATPNSHGYLRVIVTYSCKRKSLFVHKLVARIFCGEKPSKHHEVCHKNGNRLDNTAKNIYWGTKKQNASDRDKHGRTAVGERNGASKLNAHKIAQIIEMKSGGFSNRKIAAILGVSEKTILNFIRRKYWKHIK